MECDFKSHTLHVSHLFLGSQWLRMDVLKRWNNVQWPLRSNFSSVTKRFDKLEKWKSQETHLIGLEGWLAHAQMFILCVSSSLPKPLLLRVGRPFLSLHTLWTWYEWCPPCIEWEGLGLECKINQSISSYLISVGLKAITQYTQVRVQAFPITDSGGVSVALRRWKTGEVWFSFCKKLSPVYLYKIRLVYTSGNRKVYLWSVKVEVEISSNKYKVAEKKKTRNLFQMWEKTVWRTKRSFEVYCRYLKN